MPLFDNQKRDHGGPKRTALVYADHFSKGNQAGKKAIDRISGSGVTARDPDAIVTITELEDEGGGCLYEHSRQKSHTASNPTTQPMSKEIKQLLKTITPDQADEIRSVNYKLWRAIFDFGRNAERCRAKSMAEYRAKGLVR